MPDWRGRSVEDGHVRGGALLGGREAQAKPRELSHRVAAVKPGAPLAAPPGAAEGPALPPSRLRVSVVRAWKAVTVPQETRRVTAARPRHRTPGRLSREMGKCVHAETRTFT